MAKARGFSGNADGHPSRELLTGLPGPIWPGHRIPRRARLTTPPLAPARRPSSKARSGFSPRERLTVERPNRLEIGKAPVSDSALLPHWRENGNRTGSALSPWLKPGACAPKEKVRRTHPPRRLSI